MHIPWVVLEVFNNKGDTKGIYTKYIHYYLSNAMRGDRHV